MKMSKSNKRIDEQFKSITQIQNRIYERFNHIQEHQKEYLNKQADILQIQQQRKLKMAGKSKAEIVKHPYNNNFWKQIANVITQRDYIQLNEIEERKKQRERIRYEMEERNRRDQMSSYGFKQDEWGYGQFDENETKAVRYVKEQKVPWRLMRELRRKQVQENKRRLQKIQQNQIAKMANYHKY